MSRRKQLTAADWALDQLQQGHAITHPDAIMAGRGWRLAARVHDLRKAGIRILTRRGRAGMGIYTLPDDRQIELLSGGDAGHIAGGSAGGEATKANGGDHE
jgi:hypothetical protein